MWAGARGLRRILRPGPVQLTTRTASGSSRLKNIRRKDENKDDNDKTKPKATYKPEYDYSVGPATYSYTTDVNRELFERFPLVTSKQLAQRKDRPRKVRMLARDFMDDSLYNPHYGYFAKEVDIFTPSAPFDYHSIANEDEFMVQWTQEYKRYSRAANQHARESPENQELTDAQEQGNKAGSGSGSGSGSDLTRAVPKHQTVSRQVWHTPVELFRPHYARALARYLLVNYKLSLYPYHDLVIYEMGGGNGTLMLDMLDYIRETQADVYERTRYNIIEISSALAQKQQAKARGTAAAPHSEAMARAASAGHADKVRVINKSIFDWDTEVPEPCFFVAMEVFDNFAHDVLRYDNTSLEPHQGYVVVDDKGDFTELYSKELDPWARKFLELRAAARDFAPAWELGYHPLAQPRPLRTLKNIVYPLRGSLSDPEYIPTRYVEFLHVLKRYFPEHRLLAADFTHLESTIPGYCAPVVQTVLEGQMVPISTYMALQGFFDILFPTDFDLAAQLYAAVIGRTVQPASHRQFLEAWAELDATATKTGENPMLSFYKNAAFLHS